MTEQAIEHKNIEQKYIETEQKFLPLFPERLEQFRKCASKIVQVYLSHPDEEFSLRLREQTVGDETNYAATLKSTGQMTDQGVRRYEFTSDISRERYEYYQKGAPTIQKYRVEPHENIAIDFFDDGHIHVESENVESWNQFLAQHRMENDFVDVTADKIVDNEWRAHYAYRQQNQGREAMSLTENLEAQEITEEILDRWQPGERLVVTVSGRSGSGKTTLLQNVREALQNRHVTSTILSTDNYNIGKKRLYEMGGGTWTNFDADEVYDLQLCLNHARMLAAGAPVPNYRFDFRTEETQPIQYLTHPKDILFIEGIKAHHQNFRELADLHYDIPTPLATCIGRRILRDLTERPRFSPEQNLAYYLEYTEPEYRALQ